MKLSAVSLSPAGIPCSIYFPTDLFPTSVIGVWFTESTNNAETCTVSDPDLTTPGEDELEPVAQTPDSNAMMPVIFCSILSNLRQVYMLSVWK